MRLLALAAILSAACASTPAPRTPAKPEVVVLSTLHTLHADTPAYGFDELQRAIERLRPDVLAVELTAADLASRREQKNKVEYAGAVFPVADRLGIPMVPLEPDEPEWSRLVGLLRAALAEADPVGAAAFAEFQESLYAEVRPRWTSPAAVNDASTDLVFAVKHRWQSAIYGAGEAEGWEAWNRHFLARILAAAQAHPGGRVVATVGFEHGYWLRRELAKEPGITLLDTAELLAR